MMEEKQHKLMKILTECSFPPDQTVKIQQPQNDGRKTTLTDENLDRMEFSS